MIARAKSRKRPAARPNGGDVTIAELVERLVRERLAQLPALQPSAAPAAPERLAYTPREAAQVVGCGYVRVYKALKTGELSGVRVARRKTLIRRVALDEWLSNLPPVKP